MNKWGWDYMRKYHDDLTIEELEEADMEVRFEALEKTAAVAVEVLSKALYELTEVIMAATKPAFDALIEAATEIMNKFKELEPIEVEYKDRGLTRQQKFDRTKSEKPVHQYIKPVRIKARSKLR